MAFTGLEDEVPNRNKRSSGRRLNNANVRFQMPVCYVWLSSLFSNSNFWFRDLWILTFFISFIAMTEPSIIGLVRGWHREK